MNRNEKFKIYLENLFAEKKQKNSKYSMSAFSKLIGVPVSTLSRVFRGERKLTDKMVLKIAENLDLSELQYKTLMGIEHKKKDITDYAEIEEEHFKVISDWYHFAILNLVKLPEFESSATWIAKRLGLKKYEVEDALDRLLKLNFLKINDKGQYVNSLGPSHNTSNTSVAIKKHLKGIIKNAYKSIDTVDSTKTVHSSLTLPIDIKSVPKIKEKYNKFKAEIDEYVETNYKNMNEVYHMSFSFFPARRIS